MEFKPIFILIDGSLAALSIILGIIALCAFIFDPELRRVPSNRFLFQLLITNFFVAAGGILLSIHNPENEIFRWFVPCYIAVSLTSYMLCLIVITLDRFIAVTWPFYYAEKATLANSNRIIFGFWVVVAIVCASGITDGLLTKGFLTHIMFFSASLIGALSLLVTNATIFRFVRQQEEYLRTITVVADNASRKNVKRAEMNSAYLCIAIVASFVVFRLPHTIYGILVGTHVIVRRPLPQMATTSLYFVDQLINLVFYVFWKSDVRDSLLKLFRKYFGTQEIGERRSPKVSFRRITI